MTSIVVRFLARCQIPDDGEAPAFCGRHEVPQKTIFPEVSHVADIAILHVSLPILSLVIIQ
jgi:hypothetical protein